MRGYRAARVRLLATASAAAAAAVSLADHAAPGACGTPQVRAHQKGRLPGKHRLAGGHSKGED